MSNRRDDVALGQGGGRLVHDEDARVMRKRAQDLDPLTIADRQRPDDLVGGEIVDLERGQKRFRLGAHGAPVDPAHPRARRMAEENVLRHRQLGEQQQLLIDRRHAGALGVVGRRERVSRPSIRIAPPSGW